MSFVNTHRANGRQIPDNISRTSSVNTVTSATREGVSEIAAKLGEIDIIIDSIDDSPGTGCTPNVGELLGEISELKKDVNSIKVAQQDRVRKLRDEVKDDTTKQIIQTMGGEIKSIIADTVSAQVKKEVEEWGNKPGVTRFVNMLRDVAAENDMVLGEALTQFENSRSRHANSTLDIQTDFNEKLRPIKRQDGQVSELFPNSLRALFSYDAEQLVRLIKNYGLHPLDKHSENLNRFLIFIGVNASIPDQLVDSLDDRLPPYAPGDTNEFRDEKFQAPARRRSSASEKSAKSSWYGLFSG